MNGRSVDVLHDRASAVLVDAHVHEHVQARVEEREEAEHAADADGPGPAEEDSERRHRERGEQEDQRQQAELVERDRDRVGAERAAQRADDEQRERHERADQHARAEPRRQARLGAPALSRVPCVHVRTRLRSSSAGPCRRRGSRDLVGVAVERQRVRRSSSPMRRSVAWLQRGWSTAGFTLA